MTGNVRSLLQLEKIYKYKQQVAKREFFAQQQRVEEAVAELVEASNALMLLESALNDNADYMRDEKVCSDASRMVAALKYKDLLDYDIERKAFYRQLALEHADEQKQELAARRKLIEKYDVKLDSVVLRAKKAKQQIETLAEMSLEEDYEQIHSRQVSNV